MSSVALILGAVLWSGFGQNQESQKSTDTCVVMATPSVQVADGRTAEALQALRDLFDAQFKDTNIRLEPIESRVPARVLEEAKQKSCEYVLHLTLTHKHAATGGIGKVLGEVADAATWNIPGGGSVGGDVARAAATATVRAAVEFATATKARDEVKLEYRLESVGGGTRVGPATEKARAKADGDDLLTPIVARAAKAIATAIEAHKPSSSSSSNTWRQTWHTYEC